MNPKPLSGEFTPELRDRILANVTDHVVTHPRPRRRRRLLPVFIGLGAVGVLTLSVTAMTILAPVNVRERSVWCYASASTHSLYSEGTLAASDKAPKARTEAIGYCTTAWKAGIVGRRHHGPHVPGVVYKVPTLTLCLRSNGTVAVFPSGAKHSGKTRVSSAASSKKICEGLDLEPFLAK